MIQCAICIMIILSPTRSSCTHAVLKCQPRQLPNPCAKKAVTKKTRSLSCASVEQPVNPRNILNNGSTWIIPGWLARLVTPMLYISI